MSQLNVQNLSNENEDGAPEIANISDFSATSYMCPPKGTTAQRPSSSNPGDIRFNTDTASLEYYRGNTIGWTQIEMTSPDLGGGTGSNIGTGARGLFGLGFISPTGTNQINFITIPTLGNAIDFGDLTAATKQFGVASSKSRCVFYHGADGNGPGESNIIDYVTFSSTGNALDFGDATGNSRSHGGMSNQTRGVFAGGYTEPASPYYTNRTDYIEFSSTGNAVDFGDISSVAGARVPASFSSSTRGIMGLSRGFINTTEYITIATTGNAQDFGDRSAVTDYPTGAANSTRGLFAGGMTPGDTANNIIDYITIATTGNSTNFGDLVTTSSRFVGATSSPTRAAFAGGITPSASDVIQYVQILTTGNSVDFGNLTSAASFGASGGTSSNAHGGL